MSNTKTPHTSRTLSSRQFPEFRLDCCSCGSFKLHLERTTITLDTDAVEAISKLLNTGLSSITQDAMLNPFPNLSRDFN